jgi:hypothetical protein
MGSCAELLLPSPSLPLAGMGPKVYFTSVSNNFDAVVVVLSFVEIGIGESCICHACPFACFFVGCT